MEKLLRGPFFLSPSHIYIIHTNFNSLTQNEKKKVKITSCVLILIASKNLVSIQTGLIMET